jgi:hypothetical protein
MTPSNPAANLTIEPPPEVAKGDALPALVVKINWQRHKKFPGHSVLEETISTALERGFDVTDTAQTLPHDPRLFKDVFSFKDEIRRLYDCQRIGMDIEKLSLDYDVISAQTKKSKNILVADWDETLAIFNETDNSNFCIEVLFHAIEDQELSIYESDNPQPPLRSFFRMDGGDVSLAMDKLEDRAANTREELLHTDSRPEEQGGPPMPESFDNRNDFLAYYGGFDVEMEEGKRRFQRSLLSKLSYNATAAQLKNEALPKDLRGEDQKAILQMQDNIHQGSIEEEAYENNVRGTLRK